MSEGSGASWFGGVPARTHLALCLAQFRTEAASRWIPVGLLLIVHTVIVDDMSGTRQTVMAVLLGLVGGPTTSAFTMSTTHLRALGLGRRAQQMHVVASIVAGTVLYLGCIAAMWGVCLLRGVDDGPRYWLSGVIVVIMSLVSILVGVGRIRRGGVEGSRRPVGIDEWARLAQRPNGHRLVMWHMARGGIVSTVVAFFLVMVPGQLIARALFGTDPGTVSIVIMIVLVLTTVFVRVVQAERAAEAWMIYGGTLRGWQRGVMRYAWAVPVAFIAVYLVAWVLERVPDTTEWGRQMPLLHPAGGNEWAAALAIVLSCGLMTIALSTSILSITVTKRFKGKRMAVALVLVVNTALFGWLAYCFDAGLQGLAVVMGPLAVTVWTAGAVAAFYRSRSGVEVGQRDGVEGYFGLSARQ